MARPADERPWGGILGRIAALRLALFAATVVLGGLWMWGALAAGPAAAAFVLIALAMLVGARPVAPTPTSPAASESGADRKSTPFLDAVLAGLPQPVVALDTQGEVVSFNATASAVAPRLQRGEPISLGLRVPEVIAAIRRATASNLPQRVEFIERVPMDRWYEATVVPITVEGGPSARLVLLTLHDLSPLRRVEEMRADFVANASHELRTPLATLSGFIETLQGPARDDHDARTRFLSIMHAQAKRMARLIDDLLSLSRIELNAHLRPNARVELRGIIRQVVDGLQTLARDREVEISVNAADDRLEVPGDRDELLRVFENLVENALKYAASGKRVEILLTRDNRKAEAHVSVRDFGPGIAPEHLPRLTERFYRVDVADSRAQGGTGLGLALVKHILNRHGGQLTIETEYGRGSNFTAVLPLAHPRPK